MTQVQFPIRANKHHMRKRQSRNNMYYHMGSFVFYLLLAVIIFAFLGSDNPFGIMCWGGMAHAFIEVNRSVKNVLEVRKDPIMDFTEMELEHFANWYASEIMINRKKRDPKKHLYILQEEDLDRWYMEYKKSVSS